MLNRCDNLVICSKTPRCAKCRKGHFVLILLLLVEQQFWRVELGMFTYLVDFFVLVHKSSTVWTLSCYRLIDAFNQSWFLAILLSLALSFCFLILDGSFSFLVESLPYLVAFSVSFFQFLWILGEFGADNSVKAGYLARILMILVKTLANLLRVFWVASFSSFVTSRESQTTY